MAATDYWSTTTSALFAQAPYHAPADPLDQVLAFLDFRRSLLVGAPETFTCLVGTMAQEIFASQPAFRDACAAGIICSAQTLEADIAAATALYGAATPAAREALLYLRAMLQGGFVLAKATGDSAACVKTIDHLRRNVRLLFVPARVAQEATGSDAPRPETGDCGRGEHILRGAAGSFMAKPQPFGG